MGTVPVRVASGTGSVNWTRSIFVSIWTVPEIGVACWPVAGSVAVMVQE